MSTSTLHVPNIGCGHCIAFITKELFEITGVRQVSGDVHTKNIVVEWEAPATLERIRERLKVIGYPAEEAQDAT